jgi:parvulin-like peptidyl-prolyl isomerase
MSQSRARLWLSAACLALSTCQPQGTNERGMPAWGRAAVSDDVVSTVDGARIAATEVSALARAGGLSTAAALARLEAERLLAQEAARRGYDSHAQTRSVGRQALVQALLSRDIESQSVDEDEIRAAYAREHTRFETPEKRTATHLLAFLPKGASAEQDRAAREFCEMASRELRNASDRQATLAQLRTTQSALFAVKVEDLPAVANDKSFVPEFQRALFSVPAPGVVEAPVKTEFGWHVIIVTAIQPATHLSLESARPQLRQELAVRKRKQALEALLAKLRRGTPVQFSASAQQALATLEF